MSIAEPRDPLDVVWRATARELGLRVVRREDVYASYDGDGTLALGARPTLDPDDTLAQMVLHEVCHWIVNGHGARERIDWGFAPTDQLDWREYPTLRLQLALVEPFGLRDLLAPTTAARAYWDQLVHPLEPLSPPVAAIDEACVVARTQVAIARSRSAPWAVPLTRALRATAAIRSIVLPFAEPGILWAPSDRGVPCAGC